jgi:hypothetical protein
LDRRREHQAAKEKHTRARDQDYDQEKGEFRKMRIKKRGSICKSESNKETNTRMRNKNDP